MGGLRKSPATYSTNLTRQAGLVFMYLCVAYRQGIVGGVEGKGGGDRWKASHTHTHYFTTITTTFFWDMWICFLFLYHVLRFAGPMEKRFESKVGRKGRKGG